MFNVGLLSFGSTYFITRPAGEFLFDGFRDPLLDIANQFPEGIFPPYDKFGWFYNVNPHYFFFTLILNNCFI